MLPLLNAHRARHDGSGFVMPATKRSSDSSESDGVESILVDVLDVDV